MSDSSGNIIGHARVRSVLDAFAQQGNVPHALLFVGPSAVGKRTVALDFLSKLHCQTDSSEACKTCRSCQLLPEGKLPDAQIISIEGNIPIDAVRGIQERLSRTAIEGGHKTALIANAERMTPEAANALLKTLEEPPASSMIVLTATSEKSLLPTIVSRCAVLPFRTVPENELRASLLKRNPDHSQLDLALALAEGRPGRASHFLDDSEQLNGALEQAKIVGGFSGQSLIQRFKLANDLSEDRAEVEKMLSAWTSLLRLALLHRSGAITELPEDLQVALQKLLERSPEDLLALLKRTLEVREGLRENANVRLSLESLLLAF